MPPRKSTDADQTADINICGGRPQCPPCRAIEVEGREPNIHTLVLSDAVDHIKYNETQKKLTLHIDKVPYTVILHNTPLEDYLERCGFSYVPAPSAE